MKTVRVSLGARSYDILIGPHLLENVGSVFQDYRISRRIFVVSNPTVFPLFGAKLLERLSSAGFEVTEILIPDGEKHKTLATVENVYTYLIAQRADRGSTIVALGGGVTGDITGFVAATFLRGVPYVQVPTTLLSQVDSSVGGKTGVNHLLGKNMIGAFHQPHLVFIDPQTLAPLPDREYRSGLYEVIKYGLIYDGAFFEFLDLRLDEILRRSYTLLEDAISRCCQIKAEVVATDEREDDLRRILNFGHTVGHALEAATGFREFTHGEAVAYGMIAATRISLRLALTDSALAQRVEGCIRRIGELPPVSHVSSARLLDAVYRDKKRQSDRVVFVSLDGIGGTRIVEDLPERLVIEVWDELSRRTPEAD